MCAQPTCNISLPWGILGWLRGPFRVAFSTNMSRSASNRAMFVMLCWILTTHSTAYQSQDLSSYLITIWHIALLQTTPIHIVRAQECPTLLIAHSQASPITIPVYETARRCPEIKPLGTHSRHPGAGQAADISTSPFSHLACLFSGPWGFHQRDLGITIKESP